MQWGSSPHGDSGKRPVRVRLWAGDTDWSYGVHGQQSKPRALVRAGNKCAVRQERAQGNLCLWTGRQSSQGGGGVG